MENSFDTTLSPAKSSFSCTGDPPSKAQSFEDCPTQNEDQYVELRDALRMFSKAK